MMKPKSFTGCCLAVAFLTLSFPAQAADTPSEGTRRMAELLRTAAQQELQTGHYYRNDLNAERLRAKWEKLPLSGQKLETQALLAEQLLNAGDTEQAINYLSSLKQTLLAKAPQLFELNGAKLNNRLSVAYLRLGEQQNCIHHHSTESCLLPIQGNGIHQQREGSEQAMKVLRETLEREPRDYLSLWLYNVAAMTLGQYPEGVESQWRIPTSAFRSEYDVKRFKDVAVELDLAVNEYSGGSVLDDLNGDGHLDWMVSSWRLGDPMHTFINNGDGTFTDTSDSNGLEGITGGLNLIQTDYDNDGDIDVLVLRGAWLETVGNHPNSLLRNRGDGTFDDVTIEAGLLSGHPTQAATWLDYDNDGWLDLFIANESVNQAFNYCELFHNNGDGTFTDVAAPSGLTLTGFFKGVTSGDYDNDGRIDLYLTRLDGNNVLLKNMGHRPGRKPESGIWRFENLTGTARVAEPMHAFPTWFFDYDNDGWLDLYAADYNIAYPSDIVATYLGEAVQGEGARLYRNKGDGTFENASDKAGVRIATLAMGANFGDLDNDGWLDFYLGTGAPDMGLIFPNRMFRNAGGKRFQDVTTSGGFGHLQKGHGVSFGDYDGDGDQDVFSVIGGAFSGDNFFNVLFQNPGHGNNWIKLDLDGTTSNRAAIGARIKLTVKEGDETRAIHDTVTSGGSFGANPLSIRHIGIGKATEITSLEIKWPATGKTQVIDHPAINQLHKIVEEQAAAGE